MKTARQKQELREKGFVVMRGLLTSEEVQHYKAKMEALSGIQRSQMRKTHKLGQRGLDSSWSEPDGVTKHADFWPLITHKGVGTAVHHLLGENIRFLQHTDLHVGFSAISWHRDNVNRTFGTGPDWHEEAEPYQILRIGLYLQSYAESGFRLGFIPGSHRPEFPISLRRKLQERKLQMIGAMSYLFVKLQEWASQAEWVATEPGDAILFDPRILHSGSYITGPKYSIFLAFGRENNHFYNHLNYYRRVRPELKYGDMAPELAHLLKNHNLLPESAPVYDQIQDAWTPPALMRRVVASGLKRS
ncbi:MAG: phytanoyl-CoA dioxygenase family protein [Candidatus Promineifilaceae bacterium]